MNTINKEPITYQGFDHCAGGLVTCWHWERKLCECIGENNNILCQCFQGLGGDNAGHWGLDGQGALGQLCYNKAFTLQQVLPYIAM